jgi:hypothetical protein
MHYAIIISIIVVIVIWQLSSFFNLWGKLSIFKNIFPYKEVDYDLIQESGSLEIKTEYKNTILGVIILSINKYLSSNKSGISDYHLMKDIVDRNSDAKEEEIQTQIPVPLYLGLAGTMLGILIGVGFLVFDGGLNALLTSVDSSGAKGIEALLGGVALAMISSILGILLTTWGSHKAKNAKIIVEKNKNTFLSWLQANLLPNIPSDISSAFVEMARNLSEFNNTFAQNTTDFREILTNVTESYQKQKELMQYINRLKIADIAAANIDVYDKLKNSTTELEVFAQYLYNTNNYIENVIALNKKLDDYEKRTQIIENAGTFFTKNEKWLAENFDIANLEVKSALQRFKDSNAQSFSSLQESLNGQMISFNGVIQLQQQQLKDSYMQTAEMITESFSKTQTIFQHSISDQQTILKSKLQEMARLVEELKNLTHIKEGIKEFKVATNRQSKKIEELTNEIRGLARIKAEGGTIRPEIRFPKWFKLITISSVSFVLVACLFYIGPKIFHLITKFLTLLF